MSSALHVLATAFLAVVVLLCAPAAAAVESGSLAVSVVNDENEAVAGAAVFLLGTSIDTNRTGATDLDGSWVTNSLRPGTYTVVVRAKDYEAVNTSVDIRADRGVHLRVVIDKRLIVIGRVRSVPSSATVTVDAKAPFVRLTRSFLDAVGELAGVNVTYDARGAASGLSVRGRDPSQTRYTFNGAEIIDPLRSHLVDPDALQSARIDSNLDLVNFVTLAPTLQPNYGLTETLGGTGEYVERATVQATSGAIGFAAAVVRRNVRSTLDGAVFQDTGGGPYVHRGDYGGTSAYLSASMNLGRFWRATASQISSTSLTHPVATYFAGPLPFGYGGSVSGTTGAYTTIVNLSGAVPAALIGISYSAGYGLTADDQRNRLLLGVAEPEYAASASRFSSLDFDVAPARSTVPHLHLAVLQDSSAESIGTTPRALTTLSTHYLRSSATAGKQFRMSSAATIALDAGFAGGSHASMKPAGAAMFAMHDRTGSLSARYSIGAESPADLGTASYSRVDDASYDCRAGTIRITGPSDPPRAVRSRKLSLDATRGDDERSISFSFYDEHYDGSGLSAALVPAALQLPGYFTAGYLGEIERGWRTAGGCAGTFSDPSRIFVQQGISGLRVAYRGASVSARRRLGVFTLEGFAELTGASLEDDSGRLSGPTSVYVSGRQLPGIPGSKAGLSLGWVAPGGKTEMLINATRTSVNNANRLPAYVLLTAGVERSLSSASALDLVLTNVGATYVSDFTSPRYAVPLATRGGQPLATVAAPLRAPGLYVRLRTAMAR